MNRRRYKDELMVRDYSLRVQIFAGFAKSKYLIGLKKLGLFLVTAILSI